MKLTKLSLSTFSVALLMLASPLAAFAYSGTVIINGTTSGAQATWSGNPACGVNGCTGGFALISNTDSKALNINNLTCNGAMTSCSFEIDDTFSNPNTVQVNVPYFDSGFTPTSNLSSTFGATFPNPTPTPVMGNSGVIASGSGVISGLTQTGLNALFIAIGIAGVLLLTWFGVKFLLRFFIRTVKAPSSGNWVESSQGIRDFMLRNKMKP